MPRHPQTYGSKGGSKGLRIKDDYILDVTQRTHRSSDDAKDIRVDTDIQIHVEGGEGSMSGWKTPTSNKDWADGVSTKGGVERVSSTEMLVEGYGRATQ